MAGGEPSKREENGTQRDSKGRFAPGYKGGPGRTPLAPEIKEMLLPLGKKSVAALKAVLDDPEAKHSDKLKATEIVLDRLMGKPQQAVELDAKNIPQVIFVGYDQIPD